jgi:hydroxylamine dehydrogenase
MDKEQVVGCDACHGNNHMELTMPSVNTCGKCHAKEKGEHLAGGQGSHGSHTIWDISVTEFAWQIGKPGEEVAGCAQCHGIAGNRCDGCHTRHKFKASEARKPDNCGVCHMGVDHAEWEFWNNSYHGKIYATEGDTWDWDKPMKPQNYRTPTCAYCHMGEDGNHNVQHMATEYAHMGMFLLDRGAPQHKAKRDAWIKNVKDVIPLVGRQSNCMLWMSRLILASQSGVKQLAYLLDCIWKDCSILCRMTWHLTTLVVTR